MVKQSVIKKKSLLSLLLAVSILAGVFSPFGALVVKAEDASILDRYADENRVYLDVSQGDVKIGATWSGYAKVGENGDWETLSNQTHVDENIYIIQGTTTEYTITVDSGTSRNIVVCLNGVNIDVSIAGDNGVKFQEYLPGNKNVCNFGYAAMEVSGNSNGKVTVVMRNSSENVLMSGTARAGLEKAGKSTGLLKITCEAEFLGIAGHECSAACGELRAYGKEHEYRADDTWYGSCAGGAGIGTRVGTGGSETEVSVPTGNNALDNLTIAGGNIYAYGGTGEARAATTGGAGIGVGSAFGGNVTSGTITNFKITGGIIHAVAGDRSAACIGGGYHSGYVSIEITGGTVFATERRRTESATVENTNKYTTKSMGAGIGGGGGGEAKGAAGETKVLISGGYIVAASDSGAAIGGGGGGVGGGSGSFASGNARLSTVEITGGVIYAATHDVGAAIGSGGTLVTTSDQPGAGGAANVTISGGEVYAFSAYGASVGGGGSRSQHADGNGGKATVTISSNATVNAYTGTEAEATAFLLTQTLPAVCNGVIGGGNASKGDGGAATLTISGGTLTAGSIGGGNSTSGVGGTATITVTSGNINVEDIGGGSSVKTVGGEATLNIYGGTITAAGNIGGGSSDTNNGGAVTLNIYGGTLISDTIGGGLTHATNTSGTKAVGGKATINLENLTRPSQYSNIPDTDGILIAGSIGGGNATGTGHGGEASVYVGGGSLTATSGIGGGSAMTGNGGDATITITGGTLNADTIGGGETVDGTGGKATIKMNSGILNARSVGGGNAVEDEDASTANTGNGGEAVILISGGRLNVTADIGGGVAVGGNGGICKVEFVGGTVDAELIGGGFSSAFGYASSQIFITGGTIHSMMTSQPTNGSLGEDIEDDSDNAVGVPLYQTTITLYDHDQRLNGTFIVRVTNDSTGLVIVDSDNNVIPYETKDMYLDANSMYYLWLPINVQVTSIEVTDTTDNPVAHTYGGIVSSSESGTLKYESTRNYYSVLFPYDDRYTVSYEQDGSKPIKGIWTAAMGEAVSFYVHPKLDANGTPYDIVVYRSNDEEHKTVEVEPAEIKDGYYYYKMTVTSNTQILISTQGSDQGERPRISLDLSQNSIILTSDKVYIGGYFFDLSDFAGDYMLTSAGLPTSNVLRVESGEHNIYAHYLNVESADSVIDISGDAVVNLTVSDVDNHIVSVGKAAVNIAAGSQLNISMSGANSLKVESKTSSAIGGDGCVAISLPSGYLTLTQNQNDESVKQIASKHFVYTGRLTNGKVPYSFAPLAGELVGYHDGTKLTALENSLVEGNIYTATSVSYVVPEGIAVGHSVTNGNLNVTVPSGYTVFKVTREGTPITLSDTECYHDLVIYVADSNSLISYTADNVSVEYNGVEQSYNGIHVETKDPEITYVVEYSDDGSTNWTTVKPARTEIGTKSFYYRIRVNGSSEPSAGGTASFTVTKARNEWYLTLTCPSILSGGILAPHATAKWGTATYEIKPVSVFDENGVEVTGITWTPETFTNVYAGLYSVQAFVADGGNYDALESGLVYFTVDKSGTYYFIGKDYAFDYEGYQGNGDVAIGKDKTFTIFYSYIYTLSGSPLSFDFSTLVTTEGDVAAAASTAFSLPQGTKFTILVSDDSGNVTAYYYIVGAGGITSLSFDDFIQAGTNNVNYIAATGSGMVNASVKLLVELPKTFDAEGFQMTFKQGDYTFGTLNIVNPTRTTTVSVTPSQNALAGTISATVEVNNALGGNNVLAVELLDKNGISCAFPAGATLVLKNSDGEIISNLKTLKDIALFGSIARNIDGGTVSVVEDGIANGTYILELYMKEAHTVDAQEYKLRVAVCDAPDTPMYPLGDATAVVEISASVGKYILPSISVESNVDRNVSSGIEFDISYAGTVPAGTELTYTVRFKEGTADIQPSDTNALDGKIAIEDTAVEGVKTVTVSDLNFVAKGIYLILFEYGDAKYTFVFVATH